MSTNTTQYLCDAWLVEEQCIDDDECDSLPEETLFLIDIYGHIVPYNVELEEDEEEEEVPTTLKRFALTKNQLVSDCSWSVVVRMLAEMNIPMNVHPMVIQKMHECVRGCVSTGNEVVPMVVQVRSTRPPSTVLSGPRSGNKAGCIGLALEKVRVEGRPKQCVICLEDMAVGMEAARTPCLHVYHERCIKNWLEKSNACPLCRFQMPTAC